MCSNEAHVAHVVVSPLQATFQTYCASRKRFTPLFLLPNPTHIIKMYREALGYSVAFTFLFIVTLSSQSNGLFQEGIHRFKFAK